MAAHRQGQAFARLVASGAEGAAARDPRVMVAHEPTHYAWVHARKISPVPPVPSTLSHTAVTVCHTFVSDCSRGCRVLHITDVTVTGRE